MPRRSDLVIVVLIAAAANFLYLLYSDDFYYPDSFTYLRPAKMLVAGYGFATQPHVAETLRTPVYPLLLVAFGLRTFPVIVFQHLLNVVLAAAIYLFCMRRIASRLVALTASIVFSLDVVTIHYANKLLTETAFTALLFVVFLLAFECRRPIVIGILCGVLVLLRPAAIVYFVPLALVFFLMRRPRRSIAAFTIAALALPFAWALRNEMRTGVFTVSSIAGSNLLMYRAAGALAMQGDGDFASNLPDEQQTLSEEADSAIESRRHTRDVEQVPHAIRAATYAAVARRVIFSHPWLFTLLTFRGLLVNCFESDWEAAIVVSRLESSTIRLTIDGVVAATIVLAVIGVIALWRRDRALALFIVATAGYFLLISAGGEAEARFRVPVVPQLAIAAACGVEAVRRAAAPEPR